LGCKDIGINKSEFMESLRQEVISFPCEICYLQGLRDATTFAMWPFAPVPFAL